MTTGNVGRLSAELTLDGADSFQRELDRVGSNLEKTKGKGEAFGSAVASGVKRAAGATVDLIAAGGAYLTILTKTGVSYNSLQQNSRAALTTMLGGAEAANAQMDKLDAFAKKSPFSKQVFVTAQQQMIAFGIETQNVIPYLDALQNAVAASGGSNDDLAGLVEIFAKIKSSAKITAEDLNQFGGRGVDAATLIGEQMGKTGAEIRTEITEGTLDAQVALDALAAGMSSKFGGATDLVKQQWSGAVDRIKSANRDIGAAIAEPFVSKTGGGLAVTWGNQVADVLRAIEKQAVPVMGILTSEGAGAFGSLTQGLDSAADAVERFNPEKITKFLAAAREYAPAIGAVAGGIVALSANSGILGSVLGTLGITANPVVAILAGIAATSPEVRAGLADILAAGEPLIPVVADIAEILAGSLNTALPLVGDGLSLVASVARPLVELLASLPTPLLLGAAGFIGLHKWLAPTAGGIGKVVDSLKGFAENSKMQAALGDTSVGMGAIATGSMRAQDGVTKLGGAMKTAFLSNPIGIALTVISAAIGVWAAANAAAEQKVAKHRETVASMKGTLDATNGAATSATSDLIAQTLATEEQTEALEKLGISSTEVAAMIVEGGSAYESLTKKVEENSEAFYKSRTGMKQTSTDAALSASEGRKLTQVIDEQRAAVEAAAQEVVEKTRAERDAAAAMTDAERSNSRLNEAIKVARDVSADATSRLTALKQALDELKGGSISAEEAQKRLSATNLTLAEGLAQTNAEGGKLWAATLDGAGAISVASREGIAFADAMGQSRDAMLSGAMAAADAALANGDYAGAVELANAAGEQYVATLQQTMQDAGLTQEQIAGLTEKYLDVPSLVTTILTSDGTISEVDQQVMNLAARLDGLPEGETIIIQEPLSPEVMARLEQLGAKVRTLPDGNVEITQTGADIVEGVLQGITNKKRTATIEIFERIAGQIRASAPANSVELPRKGGGFEDHAFASGGFPSGFYSAPSGQDAIYKFAERELPWEVFISPKPGLERQNAAYALEALKRLGFPSIPISELGGFGGRAFANGGLVARSAAAGSGESTEGRSRFNITINNPEHRDPLAQIWDEIQSKDGL